MAMTKEITLDNGVQMPNSYIRINAVNNVSNQRTDVKVDIFMEKKYCDDGKPPVIQYSHVCGTEDYHKFFGYEVLNAEGINVISQGYVFLKTLPFYVDAEDVDDVKE